MLPDTVRLMTTNQPTTIRPTNQPSSGAPEAPETLCRKFAAFVGAGDLEGVLSLYAADAVVSLPLGREAAGPVAIRAAFVAALTARAPLTGGGVESSRAVVVGDLAMTSTTGLDGQVRTQVARRGSDGRWVWIRDGMHLRDVEAALPVPPAEPAVA